MTDHSAYDELMAHLSDLQYKSETWHTVTRSRFLNEQELANIQREFPEGSHIRYDGGYPGARKKEVIFLYDEQEDDFSDIVCLCAKADQRFRKIGHRDILGALMHLQIERGSFGDFWLEDNHIYLYTSESMAGFLMDHLTRINQLTVRFEVIAEHPVQTFQMRRLESVAASERADALVAAIAHCSRAKAKEMIRQGLVSLNHVPLEVPDQVCDNDSVISIRGTGRFYYRGVKHETKSGRITVVFDQDIS